MRRTLLGCIALVLMNVLAFAQEADDLFDPEDDGGRAAEVNREIEDDVKESEKGEFKESFAGEKKIFDKRQAVIKKLLAKHDTLLKSGKITAKQVTEIDADLQKTDRVYACDAWREAVIRHNSENRGALLAVAKLYSGDYYHQGFMVMGQFHRGPFPLRIFKQPVTAIKRDQLKAIVLCHKINDPADKPETKAETDAFYAYWATLYLQYHGGNFESMISKRTNTWVGDVVDGTNWPKFKKGTTAPLALSDGTVTQARIRDVIDKATKNDFDNAKAFADEFTLADVEKGLQGVRDAIAEAGSDAERKALAAQLPERRKSALNQLRSKYLYDVQRAKARLNGQADEAETMFLRNQAIISDLGEKNRNCELKIEAFRKVFSRVFEVPYSGPRHRRLHENFGYRSRTTGDDEAQLKLPLQKVSHLRENGNDFGTWEALLSDSAEDEKGGKSRLPPLGISLYLLQTMGPGIHRDSNYEEYYSGPMETFSQFDYATAMSLVSSPPHESTSEDVQSIWSALEKLKDDEILYVYNDTIMAIKLPEELCFVKTLKNAAKKGNRFAKMGLLQVYRERRRFDELNALFDELLAKATEGEKRTLSSLSLMLRKRHGGFVRHPAFVAGTHAQLSLHHRNGTKVHFQARKVDHLAHVAAIAKKKRKISWDDPLELETLADSVRGGDPKGLLAKTAVEWSMALKPGNGYASQTVQTKLPFNDPGIYWVTAKLDGGNTFQTMVQFIDTVLVKRERRDGKTVLWAVDATSGKGIPALGLRLLSGAPDKSMTVKTDAKGLTIIDNAALKKQAQKDRGDYYGGSTMAWSTIVDDPNRFGTMAVPFKLPNVNDDLKEKGDPLRLFAVCNQPTYRPGQTVKIKGWLTRVPTREQTGKTMQLPAAIDYVHVLPYGASKKLSAKVDENGAFQTEFTLPEAVKLGTHRLKFDHGNVLAFAVEEFRKDTFTVTISLPLEKRKSLKKVPIAITAMHYDGTPAAKSTAKVIMKADGAGSGNRQTASSVLDTLGRGTVIFDGSGIDQTLTKPVVLYVHATVTDTNGRVVEADKSVVLKDRTTFSVTADKQFYQVGDAIRLTCLAKDGVGHPTAGNATMRITQVVEDGAGKEAPKVLSTDDRAIAFDRDGKANRTINLKKAGIYQVRVAEDPKWLKRAKNTRLVVVDVDANQPVSNEGLVVTAEKKAYAPGETMKLLVRAPKPDLAVLLTLTGNSGVRYRQERLENSAKVIEIPVQDNDGPSLRIEALCVSDMSLLDSSTTVDISMNNQFLTVALSPNKTTYEPGEKATFTMRLTDAKGNPVQGEVALTVFDESLVKFSQWENESIRKWLVNVFTLPYVKAVWDMSQWPVIPHLHGANQSRLTVLPMVTDFEKLLKPSHDQWQPSWFAGEIGLLPQEAEIARQRERYEYLRNKIEMLSSRLNRLRGGIACGGLLSKDVGYPPKRANTGKKPAFAGVMVRKLLLDSAYWNPSIKTDANGEATVSFAMPENLTRWQVRAWAFKPGPLVGEASTTVVTTKNVLVRPHTPRFLVEKDEARFSANVRNGLDEKAKFRVEIGLDDRLKGPWSKSRTLKINAQEEGRADWEVTAVKTGTATVVMKAVNDEESDAIQVILPVKVHGMKKTVSACGVLGSDERSVVLSLDLDENRHREVNHVKIVVSDSLVSTIVDALPFLVTYPHGCTEQTLNRFMPTLLAWRTLKALKLSDDTITKMLAKAFGEQGLALKDGRTEEVNKETIRKLLEIGIKKLLSHNRGDGWSWFPGGSFNPCMTALVVHGLRTASEDEDFAGLFDANAKHAIANGVKMLKNHFRERIGLGGDFFEGKNRTFSSLDILIFYVLSAETSKHWKSGDMTEWLNQNVKMLKNQELCLAGLAFVNLKDLASTKKMLAQLETRVAEDKLLKTAHLTGGAQGRYWFNDDVETTSLYLKLLCKFEPKSALLPKVANWLARNREHGSYWKSTRDTAQAIDAISEYLKASSFAKNAASVTVTLGDRQVGQFKTDPLDPMAGSQSWTVPIPATASGKQAITIAREGNSHLYCNAVLSFFTKEDHISKAGTALRVNRSYFKVTNATGKDGKPRLVGLKPKETVPAGQALEVELTIDAAESMEYVLIEDLKPAGCEAVESRSGYVSAPLRPYREFRHDRVCFYVEKLPKGKHVLRYRLRAETPGTYSALPARIEAMYDPKVSGNSDEAKIRIVERK